ncbi:MAG TPA: DNA alkylation repair protein [Longimicrobiales bacterium]|nr:DNA alkylation repair protein [Longimicrobiales bacterium]
MAEEVRHELALLGDPATAAQLQRYFRTGPGQYGEGDRFLGVRVPLVRSLARRYRALDLEQCETLLRSPWHEVRLLALLVMVDACGRGDTGTRDGIRDVYLRNTDRVNSWDLVDVSAEHIVGPLVRRDGPSVLHRLARSGNVWERRIAIMATYHLIKAGEVAETFRTAGLLLDDEHPLIHKATGWMLREAGRRDLRALEMFLSRTYRRMPRTMLRTAIERLPPARRQAYLRGTVEPGVVPGKGGQS